MWTAIAIGISYIDVIETTVPVCGACTIWPWPMYIADMRDR